MTVRGRDILEVDSLGGTAADYLATGTFGSRRAGRAEAMARASGKEREDIPLRVRMPLTTAALEAALGGSLGVGAGAAAGALTDARKKQTQNYMTLGGILGAIAGTLYSSARRRQGMRGIVKDFDAAPKIKPVVPDSAGGWRNYLLPFGAPHRVAELNTAEALRGGHAYLPSQELNMYHAGREVGSRIPGIGPFVNLIMASGEGIARDLGHTKAAAVLRSSSPV